MKKKKKKRTNIQGISKNYDNNLIIKIKSDLTCILSTVRNAAKLAVNVASMSTTKTQ